MTHRTPSFADYLAVATDELHLQVPEVADRQSDTISIIATLVALSRCTLSFTRHQGALAPSIQCCPDPGGSPQAVMLINACVTEILETIHVPNTVFSPRLEQLANESGYVDFVTDLVKSGADHRHITHMTSQAGSAITALRNRLVELTQEHLREILLRDLHYGSDKRSLSLGRVIHWALATELEGDPRRDTVLRNRSQALSLYGALASILLMPEITAAIDTGQPLKSILAAAAGISEAQLRRMHCVVERTAALETPYDHMPAVRVLRRHEIPLEQWPVGEEWSKRIWEARNCEPLLRPDYVDASIETRDTLQALREDLLCPLASARIEALGLPLKNHQIDYFDASLSIPTKLEDSQASRQLLRSLRTAIIGPRGVRAFREAIAKWHRRAATAAALRHEQKAEQPGWPALCPIWLSPCGSYRFIPLTSAGGLVDEGNALNHCVGGYYPQCRRGDTQILSLRTDAGHVATLELLITHLPGNPLNISVGQFKARDDTRPGPEAFTVVRSFLSDLRDGLHPVSVKELAAHRDSVADTDDYRFYREKLGLDHARRAWPLYRVLLPRCAPENYDDWCAQTGLTAAMDQFLRVLSQAL